MNEKPFDKVLIGNHTVDLFFGEEHSSTSNNIYANTHNEMIPFDGHRRCYKIEIEENNYLKESELSGDQVRKSCFVKVFQDNVQIYEDSARTYQQAYKKADDFIGSLEMLGWYPREAESYIGKLIGYRGQVFYIDQFIVDQGCMILKTVDGIPRKRFLWEEEGEYIDDEEFIKVEVNSPHIDWYIKLPQDNSSDLI